MNIARTRGFSVRMIEAGFIMISCILCQGMGRYSEAILIFSLLTLVCLFQPRLRGTSFLGFISVIGFALMTALEGKLSALIPAILVLGAKQILLPVSSGNPYIASICVIGALLSYFLPDRDWLACLLSIAACTLPTIKAKEAIDSNKTLIISGCAGCIMVAGLLACHFTDKSVKVGIIEGGQWASTHDRLDSLKTLDLRQLYGYTELLELVEGDSLQLDSPIDSYSELWLIIPTTPLTAEKKERLLKWVERGGHLVIVTDHTDLFGHASVLNDLLAETSLHIGTDALFPQDPAAHSQVTLHRDIPLKTANSEFGWLLWPTMTARWISEEVDYSSKNFFGPQEATDNASFGRHVISGAKSYGRGVITLFGDSTVFANFAIYQPGIIPFLEHLRSPKLMAHAYPWILLFVALALVCRLCWRRDFLLVITSVLGILVIGDLRRVSTNWPDFIVFGGESERVSEWAEPNTSLSTAFAFIPLSGKKPRWSNELLSKSKGCWLSANVPPPSSQWIWITPEAENDEHVALQMDSAITTALAPLLTVITEDKPQAWDTISLKEQPLKVGHVATNDAMGQWWLDHGISNAKKVRIQGWLNLVANGSPKQGTSYAWIRVGVIPHEYKLRRAGEEWQTITLPELLIDGTEGEVYLGRGVSAKVVKMEGNKLALLGTSALTEGWRVVDSWILMLN